jgi:hypothetical protein
MFRKGRKTKTKVEISISCKLCIYSLNYKNYYYFQQKQITDYYNKYRIITYE